MDEEYCSCGYLFGRMLSFLLCPCFYLYSVTVAVPEECKSVQCCIGPVFGSLYCFTACCKANYVKKDEKKINVKGLYKIREEIL